MPLLSRRKTNKSFKEKITDFYERKTIANALGKRNHFLGRIGLQVTTYAALSPKIVSSRVKPFVKGKTLDVGIGAGPIVQELKGKCDVYGVDISRPLLKKANKRGANVVRGDAENLPFKSASFDSAMCLETLGHIENPRKVLREINRSLKPGATLVLSMPEKSKASEHSSANVMERGAPEFKSYSKKELSDMLIESGFELKSFAFERIGYTLPREIFLYAVKK